MLSKSGSCAGIFTPFSGGGTKTSNVVAHLIKATCFLNSRRPIGKCTQCTEKRIQTIIFKKLKGQENTDRQVKELRKIMCEQNELFSKAI